MIRQHDGTESNLTFRVSYQLTLLIPSFVLVRAQALVVRLINGHTKIVEVLQRFQ